MGVLFLSFGLTWSSAVLGSSALHFLQAAVVHFLQEPPPSASLLVLAAAARHIETWNMFVAVKRLLSKQIPTFVNF